MKSWVRAMVGIGVCVWASTTMAASNAPVQAISAYIENSQTCNKDLVDWNQQYSKTTISGETPHEFYYRVLGFKDWGACGYTFIPQVLGELRKVWSISLSSENKINDRMLEEKETELVSLLFKAISDPKHGNQIVDRYLNNTAAKLMDLDPPRQLFDCDYFGDKPYCE